MTYVEHFDDAIIYCIQYQSLFVALVLKISFATTKR